jgi:hypothetical protein
LVVDMQGVDFVNEPQNFNKIVNLLNNDYHKGITNISLS